MLVAAFAAACTGDIDAARARLHAARDLATRIGPNMVSDHTCFESWNVTMYRTALEVESGHATTALTVAEPLLRAPAPNAERMSYLWIDVGRAFAQLDRRRDAIAAIRAAELLNPALHYGRRGPVGLTP